MQFTSKSNLNQHLVEEYFFRNERKKQDEAWLKDNRLKVIKALEDVGKTAEDLGNFRVSMSIPDTSKFDNDKVLDYVRTKGLFDKVVTQVLDETKLVELVEKEEIDLEDLKKFAWMESTGSPRVTVKRLDKNED